MTVSEVLKLLESKQDIRGIDHFNKLKLKGLYSFGIGVTKLRAIAKSIKTNHELAMELVETECFDAIIISSMIADPKKYTRKDAEKQLKRNGNWLMTSIWIRDLLYKTYFADALISEWLDDKLAKKRSVAWNLIYCKGQEAKYGNDEEYKRLLKKEVEELRDKLHTYQSHIEKLELEVIEYKARMNKCIKANEVFPFFYGDNPRSQERIIKVVAGFSRIIDAECFLFRSDKINTNPYKGLELSKLGEVPRTEIEEEIFQALVYEIDKGIPYLVTGGSICSDGSYSGSVGRGTCSWHGGYASPRGYRFEFKSSEYERDPRIELSSLKE